MNEKFPLLRYARLFLVLSVTFFCPFSYALVRFNDGRDSIFVTGRVGAGYDSNLFGFSGGDGSPFYNAALELEYRRKAGALGVNGDAAIEFATYSDFADEDYANPRARLELVKDGGRTTGSLAAGAKRESRAESAINQRTESWNYDAGLNVKYPVIERYSLTGRLEWDRRTFIDSVDLFDLTTWTASSDLFYVYNSQRDLFGGYRFRITETTEGTNDYDHALTIGTTGKIISTINGTARIGYQHRIAERLDGRRENFDGVTAAVSATWSALKRLNVTGQLTSDFETIATDVSVETRAAGLDAQYALNARWSVYAGTGVGHSRFLGRRGDGRRDTYWTWNAGVAYTHSDRFKVTLGTTYFENWSTFAFSDYDRSTISLNISSRW